MVKNMLVQVCCIVLVTNYLTVVTSEGLQGRIVGGRPAKLGEAPYQLLLLIKGSPGCGATLVTLPATGKQFAITAAHCVTDVEGQKPKKVFPASQFKVRAGTINRKQGQDLQVSKVFVHPKWTGEFLGDIAVLLIDGQFQPSQNLKPAALPTGNENIPEGKKVTVSGWGLLKDGGHKQPEKLQILDIPVVNNRQCDTVYRKLFNKQSSVIGDTHLCLGYKEGGRDACQGDSGGPAVIKGSKGHTLVGAVSLGHGCAQAGVPGVYTRVAKYLSWISQVVTEGGNGMDGGGMGDGNDAGMGDNYGDGMGGGKPYDVYYG